MLESITIVDADQHYYEPLDCFTRHLESKYADRAFHCVEVEGSPLPEWRIGDQPVQIEKHPRVITIAPGELERHLSANERGEPYHVQLIDGTAPEYTDRDVRLKLLDDWGISHTVVYPSAALSFDIEMAQWPDAATATARAFNRWIEEDWGYAYQDRIFSAPYISLILVDEACRELERVLALGARVVQVRLGGVDGRSPAHPDFDPFWARVQDAGVPVAFHISGNGYEQVLSRFWGEKPDADHPERSAFQWYATFATRPAMDTFAALIFHNLFGRFPGLRVLSVENGSRWVPTLLDELDTAFRFVTDSHTALWVGGRVTEQPSEIFKRHFWIAPFLDHRHEANVQDLVDLLGAEHVLFGSDWPHGEGRDTPRHFEEEFTGVRADELRPILHDNMAGLLGLSA